MGGEIVQVYKDDGGMAAFSEVCKNLQKILAKPAKKRYTVLYG